MIIYDSKLLVLLGKGLEKVSLAHHLYGREKK